MFNQKIILKVIGSLLGIEASFMLICLLISLLYGENDTLAFLISMLATAGTGFALRFMGRNAENTMGRRDAYLVVTLTWTCFTLFGTMPFLISGYIDNFTDAFFEMMSGFTTTGATVIDDVEKLPHGMLFWRSLSQWIGGLGIVFFTIALLPTLVGGSVRVFAAEATGPIKTKLHPRLSTSAKSIWMIYLLITAACIASLWLAGMNMFDSLNYAMSTAATGGFATQNASIMKQPVLIEYIITFFCFVSGINFTLLYTSLFGKKLKNLLRNSECRFYFIIVAVFTLFIMYELMFYRGYSLEHAFRSGLFQTVSFITTTGLFNDDAGQWPHVTWIVLAICMFIGACSGSTSGGFKCVRGLMMLKGVKNEFKQMLHPNAVLPLKIDGVNVPQSKRVTLLAFLTVYLILFIICSFTITAAGVDSTNAITITLSALGNVGPTLGLEIGPTMSWSILPDFAKWICAILMLMGRLEIFTILVIFSPNFWKNV